MSHIPFFNDPFFNEADTFPILFTAPSGKQLQQQSQSRPNAPWPKMDLIENEKENTVTAIFELPGLQSKDVDVHYDPLRHVVTVSGSATHSEEYKEGNFKRSERTFGSFSRTFPVSHGTTEADIKPKLEHGVLKVVCPKKTAKTEQMKIEVA